MNLTVRCARSAIVRFARETVEVPALPSDESVVWLPRVKLWVKVRGVAVFKDGDVFMEGVGVLRDDDESVGFAATQSTYHDFVRADPFATSHRG